MRNSKRYVLLIASLSMSMSMWAGTITSVTASAYGVGGVQQNCQSSSICSVSAGASAVAFGQATAGDGFVSAYVQGGAFLPGNSSQASAVATWSEWLTPAGGTGAGVATITESMWDFGRGSLAFGTTGPTPVTVKVTQAFTFGTPFSVTLLAVASGSFLGENCDGGSLLVERRIDSISYSESSLAAHGLTAAPEPSTWVLAAIGVVLVLVAKHQFSAADRPKDPKEHK